MFRWLGAGALTIVVIVLILVVIAVPLLFVYRSQCPENGERATTYNVVPPWDDPPRECGDHERGFEVLTDAIGL